MKRFIIVILIGFLVILGTTVCNSTASDVNLEPKITQIEAPKKVLFIGNSMTYYNDHLYGKFWRLAAMADRANAKSYFCGAMTIPGATLSDHIYGIQAISDPLNKKTKLSRKWDVVVLQGQTPEVMQSRMSDKPYRCIKFELN